MLHRPPESVAFNLTLRLGATVFLNESLCMRKCCWDNFTLEVWRTFILHDFAECRTRDSWLRLLEWSLPPKNTNHHQPSAHSIVNGVQCLHLFTSQSTGNAGASLRCVASRLSTTQIRIFDDDSDEVVGATATRWWLSLLVTRIRTSFSWRHRELLLLLLLLLCFAQRGGGWWWTRRGASQFAGDAHLVWI